MKKILMLSFIILFSSSLAFGKDKADSQNNDSWSNISSNERKQMSEMHQKMADCLKSNKSISECHALMLPNNHPRGTMMMGHDGCMDGMHGR